MERYARVNVPSHKTVSEFADTVAAYLPGRYRVERLVTDVVEWLLIQGEDYAGWTLDGYVLPRLASGFIFGREITEDEVKGLPAI